VCTSTSVSFTNDVQPIFTTKCATAGCHTGVAPASGMNLSSGQAWGNLVGVDVSECAAGKRVVAGATDQSYLINKILGVDLCLGTTKMPKIGSISQAQIDTIAEWVCEGAPQ
jgi:hypothetical protein